MNTGDCAAKSKKTRAAIINFVVEHQPTTYREIAEGLGLSETGVRHHVLQLCRNQTLARDLGKKRTIRLRRT